MTKHEKPAGDPANAVKFEAVCARLATIVNVGVRSIEETKAIAELNHEYGIMVIRARVKQIIDENKKAAKASVAGKPEDIDRVVAKFNDEYAIVSINGDVKVVRESTNKEGLPIFELMTPQAFGIWTADQPKIVTQRGNNLVEKSAASSWLEHRDHRKYEGGFVFEPGVKEQPIAPGAKWPRYYNLWQGWGVEPSEEGSCELFKTHLREVHCAGDEELHNHLWNYCAHMFQRPMEKPTPCNAAIGEAGIGKSLFGDIMGKLAGACYVPVTSDLLKGNFNGHMKQAIWMHADEATYAHDKNLASKLKDSITCKKRQINDKGDKVYMVNAFDRQYYTANKHDGLPVEKGDRRYAVAEPLNTHAEDTVYFKAMINQLEAGGYQRLMYELMHTDLTDFDCNKCPKTQARARAIQEVADVEVGFLIDMAMTLEYWDHDEDGYLEAETLIPTAVLRDRFFSHANKRRLNSRSSDTKLGMLWAGAGIVTGRKMTLKEQTMINGVLRHRGYQTRAYKLPDPQEMRDNLIAEHDLPANCFVNGAEIRHRTPEQKKAKEEAATQAGEANRAAALAAGWTPEEAEEAAKAGRRGVEFADFVRETPNFADGNGRSTLH
jgi:hypothetical protein